MGKSKIVKTGKGKRVIVKPVEPKDLPRGAKIAMVHAFRDLGISYANTAKNLGISERSVALYLKENPDIAYTDFAVAIKEVVMAKEEELASLALDVMLTVVPEAGLGDLTRLYSMLRTLRLPKHPEPGMPVPSGGIHFHRHQNIIKIVDKAEKEVEEELRKQIEEKP